jgi:glycosyltransferase involved in cell wall biosynthesis
LKFSVIVITHNEADTLADCLGSVADLAGEIIVVDSGSTDATEQIARAAGARFIRNTPWPGFGAQKNLALAHARYPWVLSLDADERLTPDLRAEICKVLPQAQHAGYRISRRNYFLGRLIRHCGWFPDRVLRLFRRDAAKFSDRLVHEQVLLHQGSVGRLQGHLMHYSYRSPTDIQRKITCYARAGAMHLYNRGKTDFYGQAYIKAAWAWLRTFIFRLGVLDGWSGWQIARMNAATTYAKYTQLREMRRQRS